MNRNLDQMYKEGLDVNHDFALQRIYEAGVQDGLDMAIAATLPEIVPPPEPAPAVEATGGDAGAVASSVVADAPADAGAQGDGNDSPAEAPAGAADPVPAFVDTVPAAAADVPGPAASGEPAVVNAPVAASVEGPRESRTIGQRIRSFLGIEFIAVPV